MKGKKMKESQTTQWHKYSQRETPRNMWRETKILWKWIYMILENNTLSWHLVSVQFVSFPEHNSHLDVRTVGTLKDYLKAQPQFKLYSSQSWFIDLQASLFKRAPNQNIIWSDILTKQNTDIWLSSKTTLYTIWWLNFKC